VSSVKTSRLISARSERKYLVSHSPSLAIVALDPPYKRDLHYLSIRFYQGNFVQLKPPSEFFLPHPPTFIFRVPLPLLCRHDIACPTCYRKFPTRQKAAEIRPFSSGPLRFVYEFNPSPAFLTDRLAPDPSPTFKGKL